LLPESNGRESTLEAFNRLTEQNAWFPFRAPDSSCEPTDADKADAALFDEWKDNYSKSAKNGAQTFKAFTKRWNLEVSRRFVEWSIGDEDIVQIQLKSEEQMLQYHDKLVAY
jgi:hypothetical protein